MKSLRTIFSLVSCGVVLGSLMGCASETGSEPSGESSSDLSTSSNEHAAYSFFVGKGLSHVQSAAIVGNLMQESGVSPTIAQPGGPGRGIAQWSVGARWDSKSNDNMRWFASTHGESATSLNAQLEFIWYELQNFSAYGLSRLRSASTLSSAVLAFQTDFEVCGACNQSRRIQDAQQVLNAFGNEAGGATGTGTDTGTGSGATADGCFSSTLDKEMPANACVQSQSDSRWYQCDNGSWVSRASVAAACNGEFPL